MPIACPKCGYTRKATDTAPDWQCPACGIAIHKYQANLAEAQALKATIVADSSHTEPRLALPNRVASAAPDLATAALFLWCWLAPTAWRPTLASELGSLMMMEFFAIHAGMFLGGTASVQREAIGVRLVAAAIVIAFYVPVAGAFAYFHFGWGAFLAFGWLLLARVISMLAGQGSGEFESKRQRFYWGTSVACYVLLVLVVIVLPMPQLGFRNAADVFWGKGWAVRPQEIIAWGFLYFGALAVTKLCERSEWVERGSEPA